MVRNIKGNKRSDEMTAEKKKERKGNMIIEIAFCNSENPNENAGIKRVQYGFCPFLVTTLFLSLLKAIRKEWYDFKFVVPDCAVIRSSKNSFARNSQRKCLEVLENSHFSSIPVLS